jgi:hypothetical protein
LFYNLSINSFMRGLKFAALSHFLEQPAAFLCIKDLETPFSLV